MKTFAQWLVLREEGTPMGDIAAKTGLTKIKDMLTGFAGMDKSNNDMKAHSTKLTGGFAKKVQDDLTKTNQGWQKYIQQNTKVPGFEGR